MSNLQKFSRVEVDGKFIFKNCLFRKISAEAGLQQGDKNPRNFKPDDEVGVVTAEARAPDPTTPDHEEVNPDDGGDQ